MMCATTTGHDPARPRPRFGSDIDRDPDSALRRGSSRAPSSLALLKRGRKPSTASLTPADDEDSRTRLHLARGNAQTMIGTRMMRPEGEIWNIKRRRSPGLGPSPGHAGVLLHSITRAVCEPLPGGGIRVTSRINGNKHGGTAKTGHLRGFGRRHRLPAQSSGRSISRWSAPPPGRHEGRNRRLCGCSTEGRGLQGPISGHRHDGWPRSDRDRQGCTAACGHRPGGDVGQRLVCRRWNAVSSWTSCCAGSIPEGQRGDPCRRLSPEGGRESACALIGGETAEMLGSTRGRRDDRAGFAVGAAERARCARRISRENFGGCGDWPRSSGVHADTRWWPRSWPQIRPWLRCASAVLAGHEVGGAFAEPTRLDVNHAGARSARPVRVKGLCRISPAAV